MEAEFDDWQEEPEETLDGYGKYFLTRVVTYLMASHQIALDQNPEDPIDQKATFEPGGQQHICHIAAQYGRLLGAAAFQKQWDDFLEHLSRLTYDAKGIFRKYEPQTLRTFILVLLGNRQFQRTSGDNPDHPIQVCIMRNEAETLFRILRTMFADPPEREDWSAPLE